MKYSPRNPVQIGDIFPSNNYGLTEVTAYDNANQITIRFLNTGYTSVVAACSLRAGRVADHKAKSEVLMLKRKAERERVEASKRKMAADLRARQEAKLAAKVQAEYDKAHKPTVFGVGYLGVGPHRAYVSQSMDSHAYRVWRAMLARCYYVKDGKQVYPYYKGCTVVDEWHNFQNFAQWFADNWPEGAEAGEYQLDKDTIVDNNQVYGPDMCRFVTQRENLDARKFGVRKR